MYNQFRGASPKIAEKYTLSKRFDEPTYYSFKLIFGSQSDVNYNSASNSALYDVMPHPLFFIADTLKTIGGFTGNSVYSSFTPENSYSAVSYLENANEPTRAEMLREFILKFENLQYDFPYYFQSIDGVNELLKVDPTKGQRILNDKRINITCLEGLDGRMSYLMNLYKKIAWDDVYQRWVLPDMMRYFTLKIYLSEFRTFHLAKLSESATASGYGDNLKSAASDSPLFLTILDDILPTWEITCEMCEFDITDVTYEHLNGLTIAGDPTPGAIKFGVKIGNIKELQTYPVFKHMFLSDRKLNGVNRSKDEISTLSENPINAYQYPVALQLAQDRDPGSPLTQHKSGRPYNERINQNTTGDTRYTQSNAYNDRIPENQDAVRPETWVGNAIDIGKALGTNFVKKIIDKAKITTIPNLGVSLTEITTALQSKNIVSALGLIRKGINEVANEYNNAPSSRLEQPIQTDMIMRQFITELSKISKSDATDENTIALIEAANIVLNEKGVWEKIKDYSMATNLTGQGEINILKSVEGAAQYRAAVIEQSLLSSTNRPLDNNAGIPHVAPNAVSGNLNEEPTMLRGTASSNLNDQSLVSDINRGTSSERLDSNTEGSALNEGKASERLSSTTEGSGVTRGKASDHLSENVDGGMKLQKSSTGLSNEIADGAAIKMETPNVRTKTIPTTRIIEATPSTILNNKIEGDLLKQPKVSQATNSKLEQ